MVSFKKSAFSLGFYEAPGVDFSRFSSPRKLKKHVFYEGFKVFAVWRAGPENGRKKPQNEPRKAPRRAQNPSDLFERRPDLPLHSLLFIA